MEKDAFIKRHFYRNQNSSKDILNMLRISLVLAIKCQYRRKKMCLRHHLIFVLYARSKPLNVGYGAGMSVTDAS